MILGIILFGSVKNVIQTVFTKLIAFSTQGNIAK